MMSAIIIEDDYVRRSYIRMMVFCSTCQKRFSSSTDRGRRRLRCRHFDRAIDQTDGAELIHGLSCRRPAGRCAGDLVQIKGQRQR